MQRRVPQAFVDEILAKTDIITLVESRLQLKQTGDNFKACCPFHQEKTPSFSVSQSKQFYYCFGCGAHGNAIGFLMAYDHLTFPEAIGQLAHQLGLTVPGESTTKTKESEHEAHYALLHDADLFFQQNLRHHAEREQAVEYLKKRGVSGKIAKAYGLGYAPSGWDGLATHLKQCGWPIATSVAAGLLISKHEHHAYDRFRHRVIFPIREKRRGRVIAFGGRVVTTDDKQAKYLNSPETPIFHKQHVLYGLFEATRERARPSQLVVVEGYMDVVALAQYGIHDVVATLGTAISTHHLKLLFQEVSEIIVCFDGDAAGQRAAWRALEISLPLVTEQRQVRFLFMPEGEDPDSFIRKHGTETFLNAKKAALPLAEFLLKEGLAKFSLNTLDGRSSVIAFLLPLIRMLANPILRDLIIEKLAQRIHLRPERLRMLLAQAGENTPISGIIEKKPLQRQPKKVMASALSPLEQALSLLLQYPKLAQQAQLHTTSLSRAADDKTTKIFLEILELYCKYPHLNTAGILEIWRGLPEEEYLARLSAKQWLLPESALAHEMVGALKKTINERQSTVTQAVLDRIEYCSPDELSAEDKAAITAMFSNRQDDNE